MQVKDNGICIRKMDYSETSQILTFFTRDGGLVGGIAKGSRRNRSAFGGAVELFSMGEIIYIPARGDGLATITDFAPRPLFSTVRVSQTGLNAAYFTAEMLAGFISHNDPHQDLYDKTLHFLLAIQQDRSASACLRNLIDYQLMLLREVGLGLSLERCVNCSVPLTRSGYIYFSSDAGGLICRDCEPAFVSKIPLSNASAAMLAGSRQLSDAPLRTIIEIEKLIINHITHIRNKLPRTAQFFLDM